MNDELIIDSVTEDVIQKAKQEQARKEKNDFLAKMLGLHWMMNLFHRRSKHRNMKKHPAKVRAEKKAYRQMAAASRKKNRPK